MRIGYTTWGMLKVPYEVFIPELHRMGYTAITISVIPEHRVGGETIKNAAALETLTADDRRRIKAELEQRDLRLPAVMGHHALVGGDAEWAQRQLRALKAAVDFCVEVAPKGQPVPVMETGLGGRSGDFEACQQQMLDRAGELVAHGAQRGVVIGLEPHVGQAIDRPERAEWLVQALDSPFARVDFDSSHFEVGGWPMEEAVRRLVPVTAAMEVKDQRVRYADEAEPEGWAVPGNGSGQGVDPDGRRSLHQFLLGGEGTFDLAGFLRLADRAGWRDAVCYEASVQVQQRPGYDAVAGAATTYRWMADAWERAGVSKE